MDPVTLALLLSAVGTGVSAYAAANQPKPGGTTQQAQPQGGGSKPAQNVFSVDTPQKASKLPGPVTSSMDPFLASLLGPLLAPTRTDPGMGVLKPGGEMNSQQPMPPTTPIPGVEQPKSKIAQILGSVPEGLAAAAPFLGMQDQRQPSTHVVGAQGGGAGGQMVQGLNLPRRTSIAELLASLPRPRYG